MALKKELQLFHVVAAFLFSLSCYWTVLGKETTDIIVIDTPEDENDVTVATEEDHEEITSIFQPTGQWQVVKRGQAIPAGLHVRIDLSTGLREAKLLDANAEEEAGEEDPDHMMYWREGDKEGVLHNKHKYFTRDELKDAMKLFRANQDDVQNQETKKRLGEQFRSIEELKKDFEAMDMKVETDVEVMTKLLDRYNRTGATVQEQAITLHELEYYVHQIDNAKDLVTIGGLQLVLDALNSTEDTVRLEAAYVLGSAVQSNPHVQVQAVDSGALQLLLQILATSKSVPLRRKVMYATSSLLRMFPYAQEKFLDLGGLSIFSGLFQEMGPAAAILKVKAVTLLHDFLVEKITASNGRVTASRSRHSDLAETLAVTLLHDLLVEKSNTIQYDDPSDSVHQMRKAQYARVDLLAAMLDQGWCELVPSLLDVPDNDIQGKVLQAMTFLMEPCQHFSRDQSVVQRLTELRTNLDRLIGSEGAKDSYFDELALMVDTILSHIAS